MEYITANTLIENGETNHFVRLEDDKTGEEYILDVDQNILFLFFPFLLWILPVYIQKVKNNGSFIRKNRVNAFYVGIFAYIIGKLLSILMEKCQLYVEFPGKSIFLMSIAIALMMHFLIKKNCPNSVGRKIKCHVYPVSLSMGIKGIFYYLVSIGLFVVLISYALSTIKTNIIMFLAATCFIWVMFFLGNIFVNLGKLKIKIID